jgi:hypothetical protein
MTDRHGGYVVILEHNIREDDAQATMAALTQIKGVMSVEPIKADINITLAEGRAKAKLVRKLYDFVADFAKGE